MTLDPTKIRFRPLELADLPLLHRWLNTDFVNRDDPVQKRAIEADRQKALAELARLNKAVIDGNKAIADLEEAARRAGVPPGWLR